MSDDEFNTLIAWVVLQCGDNGKLVLRKDVCDSIHSKFTTEGHYDEDKNFVITYTEDK